MFVQRSTCPSCGSADSFLAEEIMSQQGLEIRTERLYCNPCPYQERWVKVNGIIVFHDVSDGNTMRVVMPS